MIADDWNGFNVLHTAAARVGGLDLGLVPGKGGSDVEGILKAAGKGEIKAVYLLGADEIDTDRLGDAFVIYQGHHGDRGAARADVILPGAAYTEKDGVYVNTEGRPQRAKRAIFPPGEAQGGLEILRALSEALGRTLPSTPWRGARPHGRAGAASRRSRTTSSRRPGGLRRARARSAARAVRLADRGFLSHRPDQPRLGRDGRVQRAACRPPPSRRPAPMAEFWTGYAWPTIWIVIQILIVLVPLLIAVAYLTYAERKVIAAMQLRQGPKVVGPMGLLAADRRRPQDVRQGDRDPDRRQQVVFIMAPMVTFVLATDRLGGDPVRAGPGDLRHQRRHPLSVRDLLARRLRHHHGRLGEQLALRVPRRPALRGADGVLRDLDRPRSSSTC